MLCVRPDYRNDYYLTSRLPLMADFVAEVG